MNIKKYFYILLSFVAINLSAQSEKPNVIIILTDDQGYGDLSCSGNPILETPALDDLHNESIRFTDFHVAPKCTMTRGQLMTGIDGMRSNCSSVTRSRFIPKRELIMMPQIFKDNGYATGLFGKWHLGDNFPDRPMDKGFDKCDWIKGWGLRSESEYDNDYYATRYRNGLAGKVETDMYCTDLWFQQARNWMEEKQDSGEPFFTYIALNAPHGPFDAPTEDYNYYKGKVADQKVASFFGMIRNIDTNIAGFEQWMVSRGLKENTILIYMGDNGTANGETIYNAGLRGKKGDHYEGGHRAPCFIRWPKGNLILPQTISTPTQVQDILPSLIDLAQLVNTTNAQFDGISLAPLLKGDLNELEDRMFVVQYAKDNSNEDYKYSGSIVWGKWRLVLGNELYDLGNDLSQTTNVASQNPDVVNAMKAFYEDWWLDVPRGNDQIVPLRVDLENENPVLLNSAGWETNAVNAQWNLAAAAGGSKGGKLHLYIEKAGSYHVELSRWPFTFNQSLTSGGISHAIGGTPINRGVALPIEYGAIQLGTGAVITQRKSNLNSTKISFNLDLNQGATTLQAWFKDSDMNDLCGAYYVRIGEGQDIDLAENKTFEIKKNNCIYPNPVEEYLFLDKKYNYEIYNLSGQEVLCGSEQNIDVSMLITGAYLISVNNMMPQRFIKN